jgi:protease-4
MTAFPGGTGKRRQYLQLASLLVGTLGSGGCHPFPVDAHFQGSVAGNIATESALHGSLDVKMPSFVDPGNMVETVVRAGQGQAPCARIAVIDVDGLLLNQNFGSVVSIGDNPLASLRDKLDAAANDARVRAVVLRINSPGGSVTACDIMSDELRRFRAETRKPIVACLMDVATSGAYLLAAESDLIVAHPTAITGGLGVVFNHFNLQDAMAQLNVVADPIKAGDNIDMGTVTARLDGPARILIQQMADAYHEHLERKVRERRPVMTVGDQKVMHDGRVVLASTAKALHLVDQLGYVHDAIAQAESLSGTSGAEVVLFHRAEYPARSLYAIAPTPPPLKDSIPFSYPGLDRSKLPSFLYLWQPDPTLPRLGSQ